MLKTRDLCGRKLETGRGCYLRAVRIPISDVRSLCDTSSSGTFGRWLRIVARPRYQRIAGWHIARVQRGHPRHRLWSYRRSVAGCGRGDTDGGSIWHSFAVNHILKAGHQRRRENRNQAHALTPDLNS